MSSDPKQDQPEAGGPLSGFAVYATPEYEGLDDDEDGDGAAPGDPGDEVYIEPEDIDVAHDIRMRPGSSLSIGNRNVYRTDRRGVPHFAPGWSPSAARRHYRRLHLGAAAAAVAAAVCCVVAPLAGIGSEDAYLDLAENGTRTAAVVAGVQRTTTAGEGLRAAYTTVEQTRFSYESDGPRTGTVRTETTDTLPPLAQQTRWQDGDTVEIFVHAEDPGTFTPVDPGQPGRINTLTLLPLIPMAGCAAVSAVAGRKMNTMARLAAAERDEKQAG